MKFAPSHNLCLFFPPIPAGEMRNDLYITLERGEFEKGGKSVARNVEITVYVLDSDGQILKVKPSYFTCFFFLSLQHHFTNVLFVVQFFV